MKKAVLFVICLILIISCCSTLGFAEETESKELLFRGVKFGTPFEEAMTIFVEGGLLKEYTTFDNIDPCSYVLIFNKPVNVAGVDMLVSAQFRWESVDNKTLENSIFVKGLYQYSEMLKTNLADIYQGYFDSFESKFEELYGKKSDADYQPNYDWTMTWNSFDNGEQLDYLQSLNVDMVHSQAEMIIMISYYSKNEIRALEKIQDEYNSPTFSNSKDGL